MDSVRLTVLLLLLPCVVWGAQRGPMTEDSLPYLASSGDTITFAGDTIKLPSSASSISVDGTLYYYGIVGVDGATNVLIDLGTTVFDIDTNAASASGNRQCGIGINGSGSSPRQVRVRGGKIITSDSTASYRKLIVVNWAANIYIDTVDLMVKGHQSMCFWGFRIFDSLMITGGHMACSSNSYLDRQYYDENGGITIANDSPTVWGPNDNGRYHAIVDGVNITRTPHGGIYCGNHFRPWIKNCTVTVDSKNTYWDTVACWETGTCATGQSAENSYAFLFDNSRGGSKIENCANYISPNHEGGDGCMIQSIRGNADSVFTASNCYFRSMNGHTGEALSTGGQAWARADRTHVPAFPVGTSRLGWIRLPRGLQH